MRRLTSTDLLFVSLLLFSSCSDKEEVAEPLKDIVGRWDSTKMQTQEYDVHGKMVFEYTTFYSDTSEYQLFNPDKTCRGYHIDRLYYSNHRYTYTNTLLTITSGFGVRSLPIITFTPTELVYVGDERQGKSGKVRTHYFVKH